MAVGPDPLERAATALRETPDPQWPAVGAAVHRRVARLVRPATALLTSAEDGGAERDGAGSRTWVSTRVVVAVLRERLTTTQLAPRDVHLEVEAERCRSVGVTLVGAYGADLRAGSAAAVATVRATILELLGPADGPVAVHVEVVDVVVGDPRTT